MSHTAASWLVDCGGLAALPSLLFVVWLFVKALSSGGGEGVGGTEGSCIRVTHTPGPSRSPVLLSPFVLDAKGGTREVGWAGLQASCL